MIRESKNINFYTSGRQLPKQDFARISEWILKNKKEAYRLLNTDTNDTGIYAFSEAEKKEIDSYRLQIKQGQSLTNDEANKEIDEWLNK